MKIILSLYLLFISIFSFAQNGTEPIKVTDMLKIKSLGSVMLNKDATNAVFTVTSMEADETNKWEYRYSTQLWMIGTDGTKKPRQLTFSKDGASQPAWSPDGSQIVFVRTTDGKPQLFSLPLDGGEPTQLTKYKYGASFPRWSADGKKLLFVSSIALKELLTDSSVNPTRELPNWDFEKPGFTNNSNLKPNTTKADPDGSIEEIRAYLDNNEKDKKAKVITKLQFHEEATTSSDLHFSHVFLVDAIPGAIPKQLTKGFNSYTNPQFITGTNSVIMEGDVNESVHPDRTLETQLYSVSTNGTDLKKLFGRNDYNFSNASVSPSGKQIALLHGNTGFIAMPALGIVSIMGSENDILTIPFDRNKGNISWSEDEKYLYFTAQSNGAVTLNRIDLLTKKIEQLTDLTSGIGSYSISNNKIFFVKSEVTDPFELYQSGLTAQIGRAHV